MILSDILDAQVLGPDGARLGFVVDVRFEIEIEVEERAVAASEDEPEEKQEEKPGEKSEDVGQATLVGLLVSPRTGGSFLGYERSDVRSPWPIAHWVRWRHRGTFLVPWEDVADVRDGTVRLAAGYRRQDPGLP